MKELESLFDEVYIIPKNEWMSKFSNFMSKYFYVGKLNN